MTATTRDYYDEFSKTYEKERHEGYHALIDRLEIGLTLPLCREKDVLEVGCGTGLILRALAPHARSAAGLDLSAGMLATARERGLRAVQGSATHLPFAAGSFDVVCSFKVLAHVEDLRSALEEMARVVRPGGTLLLEFYNRRSLRYLVKRLAGPQKIGTRTDESAVFTRFDTRATVEAALPPGLRLRDVAGIRIFTPAAFVHRIPVVRSVFAWMERAGRDSVLRGFGGFLVAVVEREANPRQSS